MQTAAPPRLVYRAAAWLALVAVAALLLGPMLPASAHASTPLTGAPSACAMHALLAAPAAETAPATHVGASAPAKPGGGGEACAAACALSGQLWVAPAASAFPSEASPQLIRYARSEAWSEGVAPEAGTPPPR